MLCDELLRGAMVPFPDPFLAEGSVPGPPQDSIFDFIDSLSLHDLDLPGLDGPLSGEHDPAGPSNADALPDAPQQRSSSENASSYHDEAKKPPTTGTRRSQSRADRIREKNRNAQARFRQKQKEERHRLDEQISALQAALSRVKEGAGERQDKKVKLTKRVADITGELLAVRNEQLEASNQQQLQQQQRLGSGPSITHESSNGSISQPTSASGACKPPYPEASGPGHCAMVPVLRPGLPLYRSESMAPRSLDTFMHFKPIHYSDILDENRVCVGGSMAAAEAFRQAQAAELGCHVEDLCSFAQMGVEVAPQVPLSYSHTLSSPQCCASFVLTFLTASLTHALCVRALERQKGLQGLSNTDACAHCGNGTAIAALPEDMLTSRKRARGSAGSAGSAATPPATPAPATAAHAPTEDVFSETHALVGGESLDFSIDMSNMDMGDLPADVTAEQKFLATAVAAQAGSMTVRVGVNSQFPLVPAVANAVVGALSSVAGLLHEQDILHVCRVLMGQGDSMILMSPDKKDICGLMSAQDQAFFEQVTYHLCAVILTTGAVLRRFVKKRFGQAAPVVEMTPDMRQRLLQRMSHLTHSTSLGDKLAFKHATRIMFNLTSDGISPLMATYEVDNQTYRMFKDLALTQPQKEQLGDMWTIWESRKRRLDSDMQAARDLLAKLPSTLPVPCSLLSKLALISQIPPPSPPLQHDTDPTGAGTGAGAPPQPPVDAGAHVARGDALKSHALESPWDSSAGTAGSQEVSRGLEWHETGAQCLGQDAAATEAAAAAVLRLQKVQNADAALLPQTVCDLVDCAQGEGGLDAMQFSKLCGSHLLYQTVVNDIMAMGQLSAMQCKRADLFRMVPR